MAIYGTALLSSCLFVGVLLGNLLGRAVGVPKNIGGVGIAMLLLILLCDRLQRAGRLPKQTQNGIVFWSSIYIPIVVAMAASQNVLGALTGGPLAILAGVASVLACFACVPLLSGRGDKSDANENATE